MYRVLVADDEPIERMVIEKIIKENFEGQLEVIQAVNGREAARLFFEKNCQIALLDIEMPGLSGLEAAEQIRKQDKSCSIIFLTAFDEFTYAKRAIGVKALEYLLKPSSDEEVIAVLEEAISLISKERPVEKGHERVEEREEIGEEQVRDEKIEDLRLHAVHELILEFIQQHYTEDLALQDAAKALNYSDAYFCKLFKQCFEVGFVTYLSRFRVERAKELLRDVTINVKEISGKVGYHDSNYFAKVFKRLEGVTPSEYRLHVLENKSMMKGERES